MSLDTNMTMVEALRLTRAGRLTEATEVLQRGLASAGTAAADESTVAQPFGDLGHLRRLMPNSREEPRAYAASARRGLVEDLQTTLPGLPDIISPARWARDHGRLAVAHRRGLLPRQGVRFDTSLTPIAPGLAATTSTFRRATPVDPFRLWSCSTAASRTDRTLRPARG